MSKMLDLHNLRPDPGSKYREKRVGRGHGSGHGKTSCKGHKGQKARSGLDIKPAFEGGQTPIIRRIPKRGFKNPFKVEYEVVNVGDLAQRFKEGEVVDPDSLRMKGLIKRKGALIKLLGDGEIGFSLTVKVHAASQKALEKITKASGKVELLSA